MDKNLEAIELDTNDEPDQQLINEIEENKSETQKLYSLETVETLFKLPEDERELVLSTNILHDENGYHGIDWSNLEDEMDRIVFDQLVSQFWTSTRVPVSNDIANWSKSTDEKREVINMALSGLTTLDTLQSREGLDSILTGATTPHETDVYNNIKFMESIHAQSYSTIFTTLNKTSKVESIFKWGSDNKHLQKKIRLILDVYKTEDTIKVKVASVFLESFLFYSGFYPALRLVNEFPNIAEIIKLIIRDESINIHMWTIELR